MAMMKRQFCEVCGFEPKGQDGLCDGCRDQCDTDEPDRYGMTEDERLDDPRYGQAASINRERYTPERSD